MELNLSTLAKHYSDEGAAWELIESIRWKNGPICPHCGDEGRAYFLTPRNGERKTRRGRVSFRRVWKCAACRKQFSVLVGTVFEHSRVPLSKWLLAIYMMCADKNGVAAFELHRTLGVTNKTAWFMLHRVREAMKQDSLVGICGTVVADETFIGGKPRNRHRQDARVRPRGGNAHMTPVLSLVNKTSGEVRSQVVADVTGHTLRKVIADQVNMAASTLHTDAAMHYRQLGQEFVSHQWVDHSSFEYVRGNVSTNQAENFFSQLKRSIDGTHHHVSTRHLHRYLAEFDFRFLAGPRLLVHLICPPMVGPVL